MRTFIQSGSKFTLAEIDSTSPKLPKGIYTIGVTMDGTYYLVKKPEFKLPSKLYGDYDIINRWKQSFYNNSEKNLGIILSGMKGTGKTITAQKFCMEMDLPVIMVTAPHKGQGFVDFITNPEIGDCIIFIDEYEKIYDTEEDQRGFLSLMDGSFPTRLIFLLTVNEFNVNKYLVNRLGRIKYRKDYTDLQQSIVAEVIDDLLVNKEHAESIYKFFERVNMWTFDLLVNVIKEMNLFNEDALACGQHLNLQTVQSFYSVYEIVDGREYECNSVRINPTQPVIQIQRKTLDYVPRPEKKVPIRNNDFVVLNDEEEEDDDDYYVPTHVNLTMSEYKITRESPETFTVKGELGKFKFIRESVRTMIF